jgi:predicted nucleic acid-binding protein
VTVVADAAPLIFLSKLNRLDLLSILYPGRLLIPKQIATELLAAPVDPGEEMLLRTLIESATVVSVPDGKRRTSFLSLSAADQAVHALALTEKADCVLSDDKRLRALLRLDNIRIVGTLGILAEAVERKALTKKAFEKDLEALIHQHSFRIGITLYEHVTKRIREL